MHSEEYALKLDQDDRLAVYRKQFRIADANVIYLDGNSLGRLPEKCLQVLDHTENYQWGDRLIRSWNEDWYTKSQVIGDKIAEIAGASAGEIIVTDTTSVNLYKLAHSALNFQAGKKKIVTDDLNFPSDIYILQGLVEAFGDGYSLEIVKSRDNISIDLNDLMEAVDEDTALVSLSHVVFKSSFRYPMKEVSEMVQQKGAMMLWDLSHSIGAVPGELNLSGADLAVGCTYKYLNGGPGSPAFLYVRKDLQDKLKSPVWGWFGEQNPFEFELNYRPARGIKKFLSGTPPILSMAAIEPAVEMMLEADLKQLHSKSIRQSEYLIDLAQEFLYPLGFRLASPERSDQRGSHVSFQHPEAYRICKALIDPNVGELLVIPDFRDPDNIRIGITPLYTSYHELYLAVMQIRRIVQDSLYEQFSLDREQVT